MSAKAALVVLVLVGVLFISACTPAPHPTETDMRKLSMPDRRTAQISLDHLVDRFIPFVPSDGTTGVVQRTTEDVPLACSSSAAQLSRFVDVIPLITTSPDDTVRDIAVSLRETGDFDVEEQTDVMGNARLIARETTTGASIVLGQRKSPMFQITAYSPCYQVGK